MAEIWLTAMSWLFLGFQALAGAALLLGLVYLCFALLDRIVGHFISIASLAEAMKAARSMGKSVWIDRASRRWRRGA